jgi:Domain of unknown function (DUF4440)
VSEQVEAILGFQRRWVSALIDADTSALATMLADAYVDTDDSGCRTDKAGILAALRSGALKLESITLLETQVQQYGNAAVLTGVSAQTGVFQGQPIAPKILFTATVVLQDGTWRAAAAQRTAAPD